jgi:hypothetical protein
MAGKAQNATALVATLGVTAVVKKAVDATWRVGSGGKEPPTDPANPDTELREAVAWAVVSGAAISVARMFLARRLARGERRKSRVTQAVHP